MSLCGYACSFKNLPRSHPTGAVRRVTTANPLELLSSPLMMETIARQSSHRFRRAFHSISHSARVWFLGGLVFCRIAVAVVVVCVEPRGPVISIGILDIQMTAVMRREFGTTEPPSSEVELGRGRANGLVHVHFLPPVGRPLFDKNIQKPGFVFFFPRSCESETCEKQSACQTNVTSGLHERGQPVVAKRQSRWPAFSTSVDRFLKESRTFRGSATN